MSEETLCLMVSRTKARLQGEGQERGDLEGGGVVDVVAELHFTPKVAQRSLPFLA